MFWHTGYIISFIKNTRIDVLKHVWVKESLFEKKSQWDNSLGHLIESDENTIFYIHVYNM